MTSHQFDLFSLPNELVYRVINHTRPFDFENILRTCKNVYAIAKPLIRDHKSCKGWMLRGKHGFPIVRDEPFKALEHLFESPRRLWPWNLKYVKTATLNYCLQRMEFPECNSILTSLQERAPWIVEALNELGIAYPEMEEHREVFVLPRRSPLIFDPQISDDELDRLIYDELENAPAAIAQYGGPNPGFYHVAALILFLNLQQLFVDSTPKIGSIKALPWLVNRNHGGHIFQQLEELSLRPTASTTLNDVFTWLLLPNLKRLLVVGLRKSTALTENDSTPSLNSEDSKHQSRLECLAFLGATVNVDSIGMVLRKLPFLRTFIWEDDMSPYVSLFSYWDTDSRVDPITEWSESFRNRSSTKRRSQCHGETSVRQTESEYHLDKTLSLPIRGRDGLVKSRVSRIEYGRLLEYYGEIVAQRCEGLTTEEIRREHWKPSIVYNKEQMELDRREEKLPACPPGPIDETLLFKPHELLSYLLSNQRNTLEHLVLTLTIQNRFPLILRQYQIDNFKGFTKLSHLEYDSRILRGIRIRHLKGPAYLMPQSLAEVLPSSIEVVRINILEGYFQNILAMLRDLPNNLPRLRHVVIRFSESGSPFEILTRTQKLQDQLADVGICLEMVEVGLCEIGRAFPITRNREVHGTEVEDLSYNY